MRVSIVQGAKNYGQRVHDAAGCTYGDDNEGYIVHLDAVHEWVAMHKNVFKFDNDWWHTRAASYTHDTIEDAQQTFNNVKEATNKDIATITLAVTDVAAETRMLRFLLTVPKIIKDYRALVLKVCDIAANGSYGKGQKNSMYRKYQKEWVGYKRYIFVTASRQYEHELNLFEFDKLIAEVDKAMEII